MSLNIKNPDAHRLALELAGLTGESMATAVTEALRQRLRLVRHDQTLSLSKRLMAIGADCAKRLTEPYRSVEHGDLLFSDDGLPR